MDKPLRRRRGPGGPKRRDGRCQFHVRPERASRASWCGSEHPGRRLVRPSLFPLQVPIPARPRKTVSSSRPPATLLNQLPSLEKWPRRRAGPRAIWRGLILTISSVETRLLYIRALEEATCNRIKIPKRKSPFRRQSKGGFFRYWDCESLLVDHRSLRRLLRRPEPEAER